MIELYEHQKKAVDQLRDGCILVGDVGSGKSATAIAYYLKNHKDRVLFIITTAKKRDSKEWDEELKNFDIDPAIVEVDSWNNIKKYKDVYGAFFIFDEQRVVGSGAWVKAFLNIARKNKWILLSATPGDQWVDYIPVFVANGFYKNKTEFNREHVVFNRFTKYPQIDKYVNIDILNKYRRMILVQMKDPRQTNKINIRCVVEYNKENYKRIWRDRWDIYEDCPIENTSKLFYLMRRVINSDVSRIVKLEWLLKQHPKAIVFYNFNYELELIKNALEEWSIPYSEWNGNKHEEILNGDKWVYLVQYTAGAEGWNCIETDTIIFYSQTYSYRARQQAAGRIDRMNTPFKNLYYYHMISYAPIDISIQKALNSKKNFNEQNFMAGNAGYKRLSSPARKTQHIIGGEEKYG